MIQVKEEASREEDERISAARADIPAAAFNTPLDQISGLKEHIYNILTEAGYETAGQLMFDMKTNANKVLGLAGIGSKAIQNIEESLAALSFPEAEAVPVQEEAAATAAAEPAAAEETPGAEKQAERKKEARKVVEKAEEDGEVSKDGVSLDELFQMKPEMFQAAGDADEDASGDKKKDKKGKKKGVALEFDEELGEVVTRKKHKRSGGGEEEW